MAIGNLYVWCDDFIRIDRMQDYYSDHDDHNNFNDNIGYTDLDSHYQYIDNTNGDSNYLSNDDRF